MPGVVGGEDRRRGIRARHSQRRSSARDGVEGLRGVIETVSIVKILRPVQDAINRLFPNARKLVSTSRDRERMCAKCGDVGRTVYVQVYPEGLLCRTCHGANNETDAPRKPKKEKKK